MNPFNQAVETAKKDGLGGGDYLKIKDGDNRIRVLSESIRHDSEYNGRKNVKFVTWVLDRVDGKVKPYFMPFTILEHLANLGDDPDWAFDTVPMPYDINIKAENAGSKEVKYSVICSPKMVPLTADEEKALAERGSIADYVKKLNEKDTKQPAASSAQATSTANPDDVNVDDIPF